MSELSSGMVTVAIAGKICVLTLNRPERRNALSDALTAVLGEAILDADRNPDIWLIAITGAGSAFCSGVDLKEIREADAGAPAAYRSPLHRLQRSINEIVIDSKKPTLAIVNGPAIAGGCELALACDLRIAAEGAYFAVPEARRGMGAHFASVALPQMVPTAIAMEWLYTGRRIELDEAQRWGIVNRVVPAGELAAAARALAERIAGAAAPTVALGKAAFYRQIDLDQASAYAVAKKAMCLNALAVDAQEGMNAFIDRRSPRWSSTLPESNMKLT